MSKTLVLKALSLLQDDIMDKSEKKTQSSSKQSKKTLSSSKQSKNTQHNMNSNSIVKSSTSIGKNQARMDRTAENLRVLKQLRHLKPKSSVAQKVIEYYNKQNTLEEPVEKPEVQRSILFDDDEEDDKKKRKRRKDSHA